ncbi:UDP-N-acetylmuramoyl-L-alanine--D-glutamate ligase [Rhodococcoides fascians]|uniref:UDP-N-acetylmuramoylalanine--D-glutamate ligase n=1 Tax=Rhodococcoides fascians TaxID=1828 RepID=A0A143QQX7_RHOFA|nr:UDP-N-acetylmuramoyl-L-alanine--D-glutamate ligase [Rhodococcus fascians]AMY25573.1 UDP-N-acetylmuramoylalanine--D-glutamate ligase [Rhodococcus fascians]KMJ49531.1 UDP-N-acetylmuramoyl-L-alanyl-D-glutamate synthetase [Rhodococcus fascians]OZC40533.1 UDP-N-acetylmuramoyl-L-alanine--D-glutamate ligase [Rhodococcus fascians]
MTEASTDLSWLRGSSVLVTGARISGLAVVRPLLDLGALVTVTDSNRAALDEASALGAAVVVQDDLLADPDAIAAFALVVTSPGFRPDSPVLAAAADHDVPVWGDVEFSWHLDRAEVYGPRARWLVVTGTNGKTTTTSMLASILDAAGIDSFACGNIGLPIADALRGTPHPRVLAVELSSFQLFWAPSVRPAAGVVLNIAEDHLDWHGGMDGYVQAKARALSGDVAVVGLDDAVAAGLRAGAPAETVVGFRLDEPAAGELGVRAGMLVDRAFGDDVELLRADEVEPSGPSGVLDALAAAALARSIGVDAEAVRNGLRTYRVGPHRAAVVRELGGVTFVDDSKATNPHAARSSILAHDRVVWIAGGLLKGAVIDDLVVEIADRLVAAVVLGRDGMQIAEALARHAPDVPVVRLPSGDDAGVTHEAEDADAVMRAAVDHAAGFAASGDTVLLAPAAASLDMFVDYGHRGRSFAESVERLDIAALGSPRS